MLTCVTCEREIKKITEQNVFSIHLTESIGYICICTKQGNNFHKVLLFCEKSLVLQNQSPET